MACLYNFVPFVRLKEFIQITMKSLKGVKRVALFDGTSLYKHKKLTKKSERREEQCSCHNIKAEPVPKRVNIAYIRVVQILKPDIPNLLINFRYLTKY